MKIAVSGKGGVGKTTISSMIVCALRERGRPVLATFTPSDPQRCSCQDVVRYDETVIAEWFEPKFRLISKLLVCHETPSGTEEDYMYFNFRCRDCS